jgi:pyridoxal 5'-phosphate synthase pdxS subunit
VDKTKFTVPFVCGARNIGEALRRINEGASMIRSKGEAGTGNVVEAIKHIRSINAGIAHIKAVFEGKERKNIHDLTMEYRVNNKLIEEVGKLGRLPVVNFAAGGIATPADAALCMQLGVDGVFVGSGIFKSTNPEKRARAIVDAVANFDDPKTIAKASEGLGEAMFGIEMGKLETKMAERGN